MTPKYKQKDLINTSSLIASNEEKVSPRSINIFSIMLIILSFIFTFGTSYYLIHETDPRFILVAGVFIINMSIFFIPKQYFLKHVDKTVLWNNKSKEDLLLIGIIIFYFYCFARVDLVTGAV